MKNADQIEGESADTKTQAELLSRALVEEALARGTTDNVTCLLVLL